MSRLHDSVTSARTAWAALVYTVALTYVLLTPHPLWFLGGSGETIEKAVDRTLMGYVQHALAYAVLACLLVWASRTMSGYSRAVWMLVAILHGVAAEWLQCFVPHRFGAWTDALANAVGVGLGWLGASLILRVLDRPLAKPVA
jgi:VanZ family protein